MRQSPGWPHIKIKRFCNGKKMIPHELCVWTSSLSIDVKQQHIFNDPGQVKKVCLKSLGLALSGYKYYRPRWNFLNGVNFTLNVICDLCPEIPGVLERRDSPFPNNKNGNNLSIKLTHSWFKAFTCMSIKYLPLVLKDCYYNQQVDMWNYNDPTSRSLNTKKRKKI